MIGLVGKMAITASVMLPMVAGAASYPPYEIYTGTTSGNPQLTYTKVCEPGRTGEANASYVILGAYYPSRPALANTSYDGSVVIPSTIGGLPVRKINDAAFITCQKLRSVKIPATVREIGARAFSDCWLLTNVTFAAGVTTIGDSAFSNCTSLVSITFPDTLSRLGAGCFQGCVELKDVYFLGNAPRLVIPSMTDKSGLGESIFRSYGYYERFKVHINRNTSGWIAPYVKGVPEKWPVDFGYMQAHETVEESGGGTQAEETGFVTVITEIKGGAVAVSETWAARFPSYAAKFGSDFTASLTKPTGKKDAAGNAMQVWQDYVAGTDPTDVNDLFRAEIRIVNGAPVVSWSPVLSASEAAKRTYTIYGRQSLLSGDWTVVPSGQESNYNFFKVTVEMR
ncbi:MAG: leucine-rich repeat domain-containing protein [Kiritimatiellae bacterium]|nr:leucine-rich repeat domain-containing protein [Kiritimatiellia bacterium]